ncbi:hypothetical protein AG1IA_04283 [Rhizoctonia solani AG-1 IA]|uniref:Uncharacterized protein n=1 Tax=Thanatephorus cucumeris (strain AG1-IA) TaxID=983506 RepID=L8WU63_THACA|nr:hypothetical protein AG1IA_04283 [Rhizoctonia solani AG-1 IA]
MKSKSKMKTRKRGRGLGDMGVMYVLPGGDDPPGEEQELKLWAMVFLKQYCSYSTKPPISPKGSLSFRDLQGPLQRLRAKSPN